VVAGAYNTGKQRGSEKQREFGWRTRGGGAHREPEVAAMAARKAAGSGEGGAGERTRERQGGNEVLTCGPGQHSAGQRGLNSV
jgi:hypothetical protein